MKIKELNDLKRRHNEIFYEGQNLMARIEELKDVMLALRKQIKDVEGEDYDPIPLIFGGGFWIDDEGEAQGENE